MMRFIKPFCGCKQGEIYPTRFEAGDECPPELESAAIDCGVVEVAEPEKEANVTRRSNRSKKALPG